MLVSEDLEKLAAHIPELRQGRGWLIACLALAAFGVATGVLLIVDHFLPVWTGAGQVGLIVLGFVWTAQFFWRKQEYLDRWGDLAYRNAFGRHVLLGLPMIFAAIAHNAYLPGRRIALGWIGLLVCILSVYLLLTGLILWMRSALTFGMDNLAMLYVYYPEEGRLVDSTIYGLIRHPVYSAVVRVGMALGLLRGTGFSIAFGLFMPLGLTLWVRLVEEPELIARFGEGYLNYRRRVPAFWPTPANVGMFWRFLIRGQ